MIGLAVIGAEIASYRREANLTQAELALRARIGRSTLDALENGRLGELGFSKIARIFAALGLELKIASIRQDRPTLEDLMDENENQGLVERR